MVQPRVAESRSIAIASNHNPAARRSGAGESGPISANIGFVLMTVDQIDQNIINRQRLWQQLRSQI